MEVEEEILFRVSIPSDAGSKEFLIEAGTSTVMVGANGTGKTRLAAHIEKTLGLRAHRISAHRALSLNPAVPKISESHALLGLRTGYPSEYATVGHREGNRWSSKASVALLNDFDYLVQALFAEQSNKSLETHRKVRSGDQSPVEDTKFETLVESWERLLPHRQLHISGDDIKVSVTGSSDTYPGSEMSDGERAVFYLLGQTLVAERRSLIIFDEPELHVHRSIMAKLWDELESIRADCAFLFITHDLEFASTRVGAKYLIRDFQITPTWIIEEIPKESGFDEEATTLILGSRRPVLFVEGKHSSLDSAIYRSCFNGWTVIPKGSCEEVIHSVVTMRRNEHLTRITCTGIIDADDRNAEEIQFLNEIGIATLPVSEIENLLLLPSVSRIIAEFEGHSGDELEKTLDELADKILRFVGSDEKIDAAVASYCRRRIDRVLKKIDLSDAGTVEEISEKFRRETDGLDINRIAQEAEARLRESIEERNIEALLKYYDNKGLLAIASSHLKRCRLDDFKSWLVRVLQNNAVPGLTQEIQRILPEVTAQ